MAEREVSRDVVQVDRRERFEDVGPDVDLDRRGEDQGRDREQRR